MGNKHDIHDLSYTAEIEAAVAAGNSAAVLALFEQYRRALAKTCRAREEKHAAEHREQESEFRNLAENSTDGIIRLDREFRIVYVNPAAAGMMQSPREDLFGKTPLEFPMPMHIVFMWKGGAERVFASGKEEVIEYEFDDLHIVHYLQINMIPEFGPRGAVESVLVITRDISEQKMSVVALRESEERFRMALESSPVTVFAQDGNLRYTWMYSPNSDWTAERFIGRTDQDIFPPEYADRITAVKRRVLESGQPMHGEFELTSEERKIRLDYTIATLRNNEGQILGITGAALDITERKRAEDVLRESEERLRFALETIHAGAWDLDLIDHTAFRSLEHDRLFGYSELLPEWTYEMFLEHVLPEDRVGVDAKFQEAIRKQMNWNFECRIRRKDGEIRWIFAAGRHCADREGRIRRMTGIVQDITERKQVEMTLRESEERLRIFIEHAPAAIAMFDTEMRYLAVSRRWLADYGLEERDLIGLSHYEVFPELPERWKEVNARVLTGAVERTEEEPFFRADGSLEWVRWENHPWRKANGEIGGIILFTEVITERKRIEDQIARLRREQEAFMRHEVKNLFAPIQLFTELLLDAGNLTDEQIHHLQRILGITKRATGFIDSMKRLQDIETGKYTLRRIRKSLNVIINRAIQNLEPLAEKNGVVIRFQKPEEEVFMVLDPNLMPGVFTNLIQNAIEHVAGLGNPADKVVTIGLTREKGRSIIRIHNRGEPIPPERVNTFFDKFNVGPEKKGGTGLGTTYAHLVTIAHGGDISVCSNAEEGTTVTLKF